MVEDILLDRVGNRLPIAHLYFSVRNWSIFLIILSTACWVRYGWDSTMEQTLFNSANYGTGVHWSTVQTFFLAVYLMAVNMQVGGFRSLGQLGHEFRRDFVTIWRELKVLWLLFGGQLARAKEVWKNTRRDGYLEYASVDPPRGFAFAVCFAFVAALFFEMVWVPLYDWSNFGHVLWPVYYYDNPLFGNPFFSSVFVRNDVLGPICAFCGAIMVYGASYGEKKEELIPRFDIHWRVDRKWAALVCFAVFMWALWFFFPHTVDVPVKGVNLILPQERYFPQTEYTYYNASVFLKPYPAKDTFGFYLNEPVIHLVNVVTKYATFGAVCYPLMAKVTLNSPSMSGANAG